MGFSVIASGWEANTKEGKKIKYLEPNQFDIIELESGNNLVCVKGSNNGLISLNYIIHCFDFEKLKKLVKGEINKKGELIKS